jgi:hypothetical protein
MEAFLLSLPPVSVWPPWTLTLDWGSRGLTAMAVSCFFCFTCSAAALREGFFSIAAAMQSSQVMALAPEEIQHNHPQARMMADNLKPFTMIESSRAWHGQQITETLSSHLIHETS